MWKENATEEAKNWPVVQGQYIVIGTLALLFLFFCDLQFSNGVNGKHSSGLRGGTMSLRMQGIFCPSVCPSVRISICPASRVPRPSCIRCGGYWSSMQFHGCRIYYMYKPLHWRRSGFVLLREQRTYCSFCPALMKTLQGSLSLFHFLASSVAFSFLIVLILHLYLYLHLHLLFPSARNFLSLCVLPYQWNMT